MLTDPRVSACLVLERTEAAAMDTMQSIQASQEKIKPVLIDISKNKKAAEMVGLAVGLKPIIPEKPQTWGAAQNIAIRHISSHYHIILRPGVVFSPEVVGDMVRYMDEHKDVDVLSPRMLKPDGTEHFVPRTAPLLRYYLTMDEKERAKLQREYLWQDKVVNEPVEVMHADGAFLMIRSQRFYRLGGYDESAMTGFEEADLCRRVLRQGKIVYHPGICVTVPEKKATRSKEKRWPKMIGAARYFFKWGWQW